MTRINPLSRRPCLPPERTHKTLEEPLHPALALLAQDQSDLLLRREGGDFGFAPVRHQANNLERGKMLPDVRGLLHRQFRLPFHDKSVEILSQKKRYRFGKSSYNAGVHPFHRLEDGQLLVLEDRICVQDEEPGSHNC